MTYEAPLKALSGTVEPEWIDYNGHMSEAYYILAMGLATDVVMDLIGLGPEHRAAQRTTLYTMESHIVYLAEIAEGEAYDVTTQLLAVDGKRFHIFHAMVHGHDGRLLATLEQVQMHVDMTEPKSCPFPPASADALARIMAAHKGLAWPEQAGRTVGLPERRGAA